MSFATWLDAAIGAVDPKRALERAAARRTLALIGGSDSYYGADRSRRATRNWMPRLTSADSATLPALADLRAASRDLVRNNPLAGGAVAGVTTAVVGTGLSVQPQPLRSRLGLSEDQARAWAQQAKEWFELWAANPLWADQTGRLSFYGLQRLAFRSALESGDVFALLPMQRYGNEPFASKVQLVEADRVLNPPKADSAQWLAGIRCDAGGRPVELYIADRHPAEGLLLGPAEGRTYAYFGEQTGRRNVLHLYTLLRPGQRRGVPYLGPIIEPLKQLGTYTEAEIMAAVIQGAFTVFVKKDAELDAEQRAAGQQAGGAQAAVAPGGQAGNELGLDYGAIVDLLPGEDVTMANPGRPNAAFAPFVDAILTQIGMALELPREVLTKTFTSSYSAARAALLDAWRFYRERREWLAGGFCQPVYEAVITEAVLSGRLRAPGFARDPLVRAAYLRAVWIGDAPGAIDPLKEADAAARRIEIGISDKAAETVAYSGRNWEDVHAQRVREAQAEKRDGLAPAPAPVAAAPAGNDAGNDANDAEPPQDNPEEQDA